MFYRYSNEGKSEDGLVMGWFIGTSETEVPNSTEFKPGAGFPGSAPFFDGVGWRDLDKQFIETQVAMLYRMQSDRMFTEGVYDLQAEYLGEEVETWSKQESEARIYLSSGDSSYLDSLAQAYGREPKELAQSIVSKADAYHQKVAILLGHKKARERKKEVTEKDLSLAFLVSRQLI